MVRLIIKTILFMNVRFVNKVRIEIIDKIFGVLPYENGRVFGKLA